MARKTIITALTEALARAVEAGEILDTSKVEVELQVPREPRHGDFSSSLAMEIASEGAGRPREIAEALVRHLNLPEGIVEKVEIAGPGFINFTLAADWLRKVVRRIEQERENYGRSDTAGGKKLLLEFVSANPTGPLGVVQGRAAALGDTLARLFERTGWIVSREYYVNDATNSTQVRRFAETLEARYRQQFGEDVPIPEDGYQGDYVIEMAAQLVKSEGDHFLKMTAEERLSTLCQYSLDKIVESHQRDMCNFGIPFNIWFMESSLYRNDEVESAIQALTTAGHTYEAEGAIWLRATDLGDDQDHVLMRKDGRPTYLAADIAYHKNKFERGFDRLIDIWGPDHQGHVVRTKVGVQALGYNAARFEILIHQIVRLFRGSELVRMSKRAGDIVPLSGLLEDVGADAARFFFLMQSMESHLDFDLELARKQAADNPVYYVQYAHARICSILREAGERGIAIPESGAANLDLLKVPDELALMRKLAELPDEITQAAERYEPHRMTRFARELAATFHGFYTNCRVLSDNAELTAARLTLVDATRITLRIVLDIIGVSAPEQM